MVYRLLSVNNTWWVGPRYIFRYLLLCSALSLVMIIYEGSEAVCFMSLCLFEACVGVYNPTIASLKSQIVSNEHRGQLYGLLRLPTNIYVVLTLQSVKQGKTGPLRAARCLLTVMAGDTYRSTSFMISSALLVLGSFAASFTTRDAEASLADEP
jgi:hypothetical protein